MVLLLALRLPSLSTPLLSEPLQTPAIFTNVLPQVVSLLCGVVVGATLATPLNALIV